MRLTQELIMARGLISTLPDDVRAKVEAMALALRATMATEADKDIAAEINAEE